MILTRNVNSDVQEITAICLNEQSDLHKISYDEVKAACQSQPNGKAVGHD